MIVSLLPGLIGFHGDLGGIALALDMKVDRLLFAGRELGPMVWIPREEFNVDPKVILTADQVMEDPTDERPTA